MGSLSIWHWVVVLVVVLLLFGKGKIPALMGDVAKGIKAFKTGMKDEESETSEAGNVIEDEAADSTTMAKEKDEASSRA
ncbi:MAG: twin-arginine translocase TatA/TatE family subunit [Rhodospirillaceae bacterium]|nr:twin-arginine translocase TatA/TatE family subunit [Rhodospirillaceae bacterium]MBT5566813.1 twin-arginine translocase TatA/TatE family subunit [Rhodospirillaceae bacterium]MBT6089474.1 twin-arginine translocase TatA/TatE family subunit [Rhodospirillaceae bacterium]MBT6961666.1 twin-arginine translocase TatA/TatE family subunit [Rhodospirillaceae bacterium]MBT7451092.1 twin-arginine translocase TatA/TatE family subunit [Rhodospirillaceae bacterium]